MDGGRQLGDGFAGLLEMRLFALRPGTQAEFDRISREGTVPMMRRYGITVLAHGPTLNDDNGYLLLRAFPSEAERVARSQAFYASDEWETNYEGPVMAMVADYHTAVIPASAAVLRQLTGAV
jgi:hypothetical protein